MSYRTYVNATQIFGNNEGYAEWMDFIRSQGIEIDEEGCYKGTITDFMSALTTIEKITLRLAKERKERNEALRKKGCDMKLVEIFDWSNIPEELSEQDPEDKFSTSLFDRLVEVVNQGYAFMPYTFYQACKDKLERDNCFSTSGHLTCFKVKEGEVIEVKAC